MRRCGAVRGVWMTLLAGSIMLALSGSANAQNRARLSGQLLDLQGKPYPNVMITLTNTETGQTTTLKSGKDGKYVQLGLAGGLYSINFKDPNANPPLDYTVPKYQVNADEENTLDRNFMELAAEYAKAHPEEKEAEEAKNKFNMMKQHFQAGLDGLQTYSQDHEAFLKAAAADKPALKEKAVADAQAAANEFKQASDLAGPKDTKNLAVILGNQGAALEDAEKYSDAADAFQKAIALGPTAGLYLALATNTAQAAAADTGATDAQQEDALTKAGAACGQAAALDPTKAGICWRNVGIPFYNKGHMKEASEALKKATAADPSNADAWYYLGSALLNLMSTKQEKNTIIYVLQPGTAEAYQKYLDLAPTGPFAQPSKDALATIATLQGGESTVLKNKKY